MRGAAEAKGPRPWGPSTDDTEVRWPTYVQTQLPFWNFYQGGGEEGNVRWAKTARSRFRKIRKATGYMLQVTGFKVKG